MAGKYRKIDPRLWRDEKFMTLNEKEKLIALYAITAQTNRIGLFVFSPALAAEDLNMKSETFLERFTNVCRAFNWAFDKALRVLYIPTWWKYNPPENPNVLIGCLKDVHDLPRSPLINSFIRNLTYLPETLHQTFTETLPQTIPETVVESGAGARAVTGAGTRTGAGSPPPGEGVPPCPHQEIIALYHEALPQLTKVRVDLWGGTQRSKDLRARWAEDGERQNLAWWKSFFKTVGESSFLTGKTKPWKADLGWLVKRENFIKVLEGKYDNKQQRGTAGYVDPSPGKNYRDGLE
jgi:hypothetical protein